MIANVTQIENVIGTRGINPVGRANTDFELIDRLDGQGIQLKFWTAANLGGAEPSEAELTLGDAPLIALSVADNATDDGIIVTATLTGGSTQTVNWRCIAPDGTTHTASAAAVGGVETWEIETGQSGVYIIHAWANGFGFAQVTEVA